MKSLTAEFELGKDGIEMWQAGDNEKWDDSWTEGLAGWRDPWG